MIHILFCLNGVFSKGGIENVVLNYYDNLDKARFHIDFLVHGYADTDSGNEIHKRLEACGSKIYYVTPRGRNPIRNKREIRHILRGTNYDIVHSHMDSAGYFLLKQAKKSGIKKTVAHSHNTDDLLPSGKLKRAAYRMILSFARRNICTCSDRRIACSDAAGRWLFGNNGFTTIYNAVNTGLYRFDPDIRARKRKELGISGNTFTIGTVGKLEPVKNSEFTLRVFDALVKQKPDSRLLFVGSGALLEKLKAQAASMKIDDRVTFLGRRDDVPELLQAMDAFLLPSLFEGLPIAAIEAQCAGLPCIINDCRQITKETGISANCVFLPADSAAPWADMLCRIDVGARHDGSADVKRAGFTNETIIPQLESIYTD